MFGRMIAVLSLGLSAPLLATAPATQPGVQIDISQLLNARVIITAKDGTLQFADHSLDNAPKSILITASAAEATQAEKIIPLIDSGLFPANDRHPEVQLPYGKVGDGPQVYRSKQNTEMLEVPVPADRYAQMQLFLISSMGATPLAVTLKYADGSSDERTLIIPDWFLKPKPDDAGSFALADNFGKVDMKGKTVEHDHHYIRGFNLDPDKSKTLKQMVITKKPSKTVLTLFGITGTRDALPSN
jgi:hypothetical protein